MSASRFNGWNFDDRERAGELLAEVARGLSARETDAVAAFRSLRALVLRAGDGSYAQEAADLAAGHTMLVLRIARELRAATGGDS